MLRTPNSAISRSILRPSAAMPDRTQELRVNPRKPGQQLRVVAVTLAIALMNAAQLARIGDNDLVAEICQHSLQPP
jgi:hypothetical protein